MTQVFGGSPNYSKSGEDRSSRENSSMGDGQSLEGKLLPGEVSMEAVLKEKFPDIHNSFGVEASASEDSAPWSMHKEAAKEDWEIAEDKRLDMQAWAREFRRQFPKEDFAKGDKTIQSAAKWVSAKCKQDWQVAIDIMDAAGVIDEVRMSIVQAAKELKEVPTKFDAKNTSKPGMVLNDSKAPQPPMSKAAHLYPKKLIGEYGIILDEKDLTLWKKGKLIDKVAVESLGGFDVIADEISAFETVEDLTMFFGFKVLQREAWIQEELDPRTGTVREQLWKSGAVENEEASIFYNAKGDIIVANLEGTVTFGIADEEKAIVAYLGNLPPVQIPSKKAAPFIYDDPQEQAKSLNVMEDGEFDPANVDQNRDTTSTNPNDVPLSVNPQPVEAAEKDTPEIEELSKKFHAIYQKTMKGKSKHSDSYEELPEDIKELDRALARYVLKEFTPKDTPKKEKKEDTKEKQPAKKPPTEKKLPLEDLKPIKQPKLDIKPGMPVKHTDSTISELSRGICKEIKGEVALVEIDLGDEKVIAEFDLEDLEVDSPKQS